MQSLCQFLKQFLLLQPRKATSRSSRTTLRKALALERLPAKLNKPPATPTIELWVQHQQQKLAAALSRTGSDTRTSIEATASTQHAHSAPPSNTACSDPTEETSVQSGGLKSGVNSNAYISPQRGAHEFQHQLRPNAATSTSGPAHSASIYDMASMPHQVSTVLHVLTPVKHSRCLHLATEGLVTR